VAALVASRREGVAFGVAPNARLVVARALDDAGKSDSLGLARALAFAVDAGARVVNCSWGGGSETQALRDAFAYARAQGTLLLSSAGNDGLDLDRFPVPPKNFPGVLNTGASNADARRSRFSNEGKRSVFLYAPGDAILSALPGGIVGGKSGTSMASPMTAGSAALLLGLGLEPADVEGVLCASARRDGLERSSRCGLLDTRAAVESVLAKIETVR
jgi:subtilisin family serine protease